MLASLAEKNKRIFEKFLKIKNLLKNSNFEFENLQNNINQKKIVK